MADKKTKLTDKQARFVDEYLIDLNATQAAIRAGYAKKTANRSGPRLLSNVGIQVALAERYKGLVQTGDIATPNEVLGGYTKDTRFDPRLLFDDDKNPLPIPDLPDEVALSLVGFEVTDTVMRSDLDKKETLIKRVYKYKLPDKKSNRDSLGKYHKLFVEQHEYTLSKETVQAIMDCLSPDAKSKFVKKLEQGLVTAS